MLGPDTPQATVMIKSPQGQRRLDISDTGFAFLKRDWLDESGGGQTSSLHAAVLRNEKGDCFIMDCGSVTGTFMNGDQLEPRKPRRWDPSKVVVLGRPPRHDTVSLEVVPRKRPRSALEEEGGPQLAAKRQKTDLQKCDKCDGPHPTQACPHFRKTREDHKDAWVNYGAKSPLQMGRSGGKLVIRSGRPVRQPGDGSCLFHSLCFGLNGGRSQGRFFASQLRRELARFIQDHPTTKISGDTLEEWVRWDANSSVAAYARRMATSGWGGGIEMAVCSLLKKVNVHVYERTRGGAFERISCFDSPVRTSTTIHVLYQGGVHYDALVPGP